MSDSQNFAKYIDTLRSNLKYVEDESFSWDNVIAILVIKLTNTDSINKDRQESHATQIQLTSEREENNGLRKTEDFFPTLVLNKTFKSWRLSYPVRINLKNVSSLGDFENLGNGPWSADTVQLRRRLLNGAENGYGNPTLQICYSSDLIILRQRLQVNDYIVFAKQKNIVEYEVFGLKGNVDLGSGKEMYFSTNSNNDSTIFPFEKIVIPSDSSASITEQSFNKIYFGAPGTGKSHKLACDSKFFIPTNIERVTFYPTYSFSQFVGTYKPIMKDSISLSLSNDDKKILAVLQDSTKSAQDKYDTLYDIFKDGDLTRLPILIGFCADEDFNTRKIDGSRTNNSVERNHGKALRPFFSFATNSFDSHISYNYVPGPFIRTLVNALLNPTQRYLLVIEELNRANAPAVFGDIFQLMDRLQTGESEYPVSCSEDLKNFLAQQGIAENTKISIPSNMYIWATMNSADQGVFPLDTAFKRRWDFDYMGINANEDVIAGYSIRLGSTEKRYSWNKLRHAINDRLISCNVNEDKLLGPFFINPAVFDAGDEAFSSTFKSKVIMYLYEDAARQVRPRVFPIEKATTYSEICQKFDEIGAEIFGIILQPVDETAEEGVPQK